MRRSFSSALCAILLMVASPCFAGIDCDGTDDFFKTDASDNTSLGAWNDPISLFVVAKLDTAVSGDAILARWGDSDASSTADFWLLEMSGSPIKIRLAKIRNADQDGYILVSTATVSSGETIRLATASDAEANMKINLNGSENSGRTFLFGAAEAGTDMEMTFCGRSSAGGSSNYADITVYEVALWNIELTSAELDLLTESRVKGLARQIQPANLKAYWQANEVPDGTSADAVVLQDFSNNGTTITGSDGANNTGLTAAAEAVLTYQ